MYAKSIVKKVISVCLFIVVSTTNIFGQSDLQTYTPSKLLEKNKLDIKIYNNFYTQTRSADIAGIVNQVNRATFFTSTFETYAGISKNARINIGFIANLKSNSSRRNALDVFGYKKEDFIASNGLTSIAASIKWSPFKKLSNFSLQSSFHIPLFEDNPKGFYLDKRSYVWENKFFYDKLFSNNKFQLFTELDVTYIFGDSADYSNPDINSGERFANNSLAFPISIFLSYFPAEKSSIFVNAQHYILVGAYNQNFSLLGLGYKYQLTNKFNFEISSSYFLRGMGTGLGETYNLGLRYIL